MLLWNADWTYFKGKVHTFSILKDLAGDFCLLCAETSQQ